MAYCCAILQTGALTDGRATDAALTTGRSALAMEDMVVDTGKEMGILGQRSIQKSKKQESEKTIWRSTRNPVDYLLEANGGVWPDSSRVRSGSLAQDSGVAMAAAKLYLDECLGLMDLGKSLFHSDDVAVIGLTRLCQQDDRKRP